MALKFYTDTHIAKAVIQQLRARGVDIVRCQEVGMADAGDEEHLRYAAAQGRILVSQDGDFTIIHAEWRQAGRAHAGIMRVPPHLKGEAQVSYAVRQLGFYIEAETAGAVDYESEIAGQVIFL